jgi:hypothetical protein
MRRLNSRVTNKKRMRYLIDGKVLMISVLLNVQIKDDDMG